MWIYQEIFEPPKNISNIVLPKIYLPFAYLGLINRSLVAESRSESI